MKKGYIIDSSYEPCSFHKKILVYNYGFLNKIVLLPCIEKSTLLEIKGNDLVGVWKIKN